MHAYIVLSLLCEIRTEEARALRWAHVDLDGDPGSPPACPAEYGRVAIGAPHLGGATG